MKEKRLSSGKQIFIGIFSVLIFWLFGLFTGDPLDYFWDTPFEEIVNKIPSAIFNALPFVFVILIIVFAIVGKLKDYPKMYWSSLIMTVLPVVAMCLDVIKDFQSGVVYFVLVPFVYLLYPFGLMGFGTYVAFEYNSYLFLYRDEVTAMIICAGLIISLVLFFAVKRKNKNDTTVSTEN